MLVGILRYFLTKVVSLAPGSLHVSLRRKLPILLFLHLLIPIRLSVFSLITFSPRSLHSTNLSLDYVSLLCVLLVPYTFPINNT